MNLTGVDLFFYNLGSAVPVKSCPSIGFPVAATAQIAEGDNTNE